jgi:hypothetical protein
MKGRDGVILIIGAVMFIWGIFYYFTEAWRFSPTVGVTGTGNFILWYISPFISMGGIMLINSSACSVMEPGR